VKDPVSPQASLKGTRGELFARFVVLAAGVGLFLGLWEARLLYFVPSVRQFLVVDATYVIWFLAPLLDMGVFVLLGVALGLIATAGRVPTARRNVVLTAVLFGAGGTVIGWSQHLVHTHALNLDIYGRSKDILFPLIRFAAVFALTLLIAWLGRGRFFGWLDPNRRWPLRALGKAVALTFVLLAAGVLFYALAPRFRIPQVEASEGSQNKSPNVVLITMDTVRADHLSAYGYFRKTTPHIDRLAARGVSFENAVAPASWTLPSLASIFTGLLPHQDGANVFRPTNPAWVSLGDVLKKYGYVTAGFNANGFYGESGWGLNDGFQAYDDCPSTIKYNLARTVVGRTLVQPVYQATKRFDAFYRRDAGALNADVFRWLRSRPSRPYFLYINYMDAHSPYYAPYPYNHRFGSASEQLIRRVGFVDKLSPSVSLTAQDQEALIASYDNSLAYVDDQVGKLFQLLQASPDWANTYVVITADHGEAFGEHGVYHHANDLNWEEIHVPLIIAGPGIAPGIRVGRLVPLRGVFSTVLDLALGSRLPMHQYSLVRFWEQGTSAVPEEPVVSELSSSLSPGGVGEISLTTSEWHYIRTARGKQELYCRSEDPKEQHDLSSLAEYQPTLNRLRADLEEAVRNSYEPWLGREYLLALGASDQSPLQAKSLATKSPTASRREGAAQSYFHPNIPLSSRQLSRREKDLLKTLPYQ
jgi:arylsulfatase A-like enzyme